jgi:hypothetical protein
VLQKKAIRGFLLEKTEAILAPWQSAFILNALSRVYACLFSVSCHRVTSVIKLDQFDKVQRATPKKMGALNARLAC